MANKLRKVSHHKWPGVYYYQSDKNKLNGKPDVCYYITYKLDGKKQTEKVGWKSEGYSPEVAADLRATRVKTKRHGDQVKTSKEIRQDKIRTNRTIGELKKTYFESERGLQLKGRKTDLNRYDKHLKELFNKKRVSQLTVLDIERVKRTMRGHAPATVSNTLELLRRIINSSEFKGLNPRL